MPVHATPNALLRAAREDLGWTQADVAAARGIHGAAYAKIERARDLRWSTLVDTARALGGRLTLIYEHPDQVAQSVVETAWESLLWLDPDEDHKAARYDDLARAIRDGFAPTYTLRGALGALLRPAVTFNESDWTNAIGMAMERAVPEATELGEDRNVISIRVQEDGARLAIRYRLHELAQVLASVGPEVLPALDLIASGDMGLRRAPDPAPGEPMAVWDPVIAELPERERVFVTAFNAEEAGALAAYVRAGAPEVDSLVMLAARFQDDDVLAERVFTAAGYPPIPAPKQDHHRTAESASDAVQSTEEGTS